MTLLITAAAAAVVTLIWRAHAPEHKMHIGILCLMYWGASLMWFVDTVFAVASSGAAYFVPGRSELSSNLALGFVVVAAGLVIWLAAALWKNRASARRAAAGQG